MNNNNNLIPNGDYYAKLSADELEAVKNKAAEFQESQLAEDIRETFRPKTYEESWGGVIWALEVVLLNFLHFVSAAAAFLGVVWVLSLIFLLFPFLDYPVFETLGETVLIGNLLAVLTAFPILYYIEKFKTVALKNLFSKIIPPTLYTSLSRGDYWRLVLNGFFWAGISFATSLFGGIETPEAVYKKPEIVAPVGLTKIDSTKIKGDKAVENIQTQYAGLIAAQQTISDRNRKAATAKPITNWGAYNAYKAANEEKQRLSDEMGRLVANQQNINLLALQVGADDNKQRRAEADTINKAAAAEYSQKIGFSSWLLGGASIVSDLGIILIIFFSIRFKYRVALENDAIARILNFKTVPQIIIDDAGKTEAEKFELEQLEALAEAARLQKQAEAEAARLESERLAAEELQRLQAERERLEAEKLESERLANQERQRLQAERERLEAEKLESERLANQERQRLQAERERLEAEKLESERLANQERQRLQAEREKLKAEQLAAEERQRAEEDKRLEAEKLEAERQRAEAEKNKGFVITPVNYNGVLYSVTDIQTIIQNLPMYYRRANAPISEKATGQNLENAQTAKSENLKKVDVWRGVLAALGVITTPTDKGGLKLTYPKK